MKNQIEDISELLKLQGDLEYALKRKAELLLDYLRYISSETEMIENGVEISTVLEEKVNPRYKSFYSALKKKFTK